MTHPDRNTHSLPYPIESTIPAGPQEPDDALLPAKKKKGVLAQQTSSNCDRDRDPFATLSLFNTVFLIDDSDAMQFCWDEVGDILRIIAPICTTYDRDGIAVEFVHHRANGYHLTGRSGYKHIGHAKGRLDMCDNVAGIYHRVKPKGRKRNRIDGRLARILDPYVTSPYGTEYEAAQLATGGEKIPVPLNVIVITDCDEEVQDDLFKPDGAIARTAKRLDELNAPPYQVGVQIFRVGDAGRELDAEQTAFLDDGYWKELGVRDIVDMTTWTGKPGELSPEGRLKVVLGAVRRSIDHMEV